ncbi:GNAT family N-acetyltransferase [Virgibacillus sp. 179-BFC.A HS]|uniref:GNAT family N-acetyltransferase n=1 Tax=Tigheibacillus jepli TaxID=3035914 RepID=A0ABU5CEU5_9BACI|nr:GNAT family N-acetyltransferase [Virgibacillus sp. 179-BFC.A HS]MDY0404354.1 GNAT family N-acetyltransferase [Virgibacillus sp. 179-BFC.A HS]
MPDYLQETPWDKRNFGIDTYEVTAMHNIALEATDKINGHFTIKVPPLEDPRQLLRHGFYYMDTLIEPVCQREDFHLLEQDGISVSQDYDVKAVLAIARQSFIHGRFHRDFHIPSKLADLRYMNWVKDLHDDKQVYALYVHNQLAGFFGFSGNQILLLGMKAEFRQKGLSKVLTSQCCKLLFDQGYEVLRTSVSAANVASLNLFYSLGFKLKNTVDVYHKLNGPDPVGAF